jgi:hypothetical protein
LAGVFSCSFHSLVLESTSSALLSFQHSSPTSFFPSSPSQRIHHHCWIFMDTLAAGGLGLPQAPQSPCEFVFVGHEWTPSVEYLALIVLFVRLFSSSSQSTASVSNNHSFPRTSFEKTLTPIARDITRGGTSRAAGRVTRLPLVRVENTFSGTCAWLPGH